MVGKKESQRYQEKLAKSIPSTSKQKGNTLSLQLQVSVTVLCIFCFAYSRLSVIDELCVHMFHFILLSTKLDGAVVPVLDSRRKDQKEWADMSEMLQR
jgi:hypothetical protein